MRVSRVALRMGGVAIVVIGGGRLGLPLRVGVGPWRVCKCALVVRVALSLSLPPRCLCAGLGGLMCVGVGHAKGWLVGGGVGERGASGSSDGDACIGARVGWRAGWGWRAGVRVRVRDVLAR